MIKSVVDSQTCLMLVLVVAACSSGVPESGEAVEPPFEVSGEAEDLLLVWFDDEGAHSASRRSDIPEAHRERVRVQDLSVAPEDRLADGFVYVADLREEVGGRYPVESVSRPTYDGWVEEASASAPINAALADGTATDGPVAANADVTPTDGNDVVIYGASWCGACRGAASYLRQANVPFIERDIEREPGARRDMMRAARAAGVNPSGIPVIDFRGTIIAGFDRPALARAIEGGNRTAI